MLTNGRIAAAGWKSMLTSTRQTRRRFLFLACPAARNWPRIVESRRARPLAAPAYENDCVQL